MQMADERKKHQKSFVGIPKNTNFALAKTKRVLSSVGRAIDS
jgi:hypothetical protein